MKIKITDGKTEAMAQVENPTSGGEQQVSISLTQARRLDCSALKDESGATYDRRCQDMGRIIFSRKPYQENKTKHMPGPWEIRRNGTEANIVTKMPGQPQGRLLIAAVSGLRGYDNAALIAAAPELLEACHAAWSALDAKSLTRQKWTVKDQAAFQACTAAIARAEGK
jgi:hypothetical protein